MIRPGATRARWRFFSAGVAAVLTLTALAVAPVGAAVVGPTVPVIISPPNGSVLTTAQLTKIDWTDSTGTLPITYQYEAFSDAAYTASLYDSGFTLSASEIPTLGTPAGVYYVRVRARDDDLLVSDWSNGPLAPYQITVDNTFANFRDVRRAAGINAGPDLCGTGIQSLNLTGSTGSAGDTWITVYDTTPADATVQNTFGDTSLAADVLIRPFNNKKGAGLLALFNEGPGDKGLALVIYDAGNTDTLALGTVSKANGTFTVLKTVSLAARIAECNWYQLTMDVVVSGGNVTVTGNVYRHLTASDPNSGLGASVGTLLFSGPLPTGVLATGEIGIVGSAFSAVEDSSVTNFTHTP